LAQRGGAPPAPPRPRRGRGPRRAGAQGRMSGRAIAGPGLHSGLPARVRIEPLAEGDRRIVFRRGAHTLALGAGAALAATGTLATDLRLGPGVVRTVEHWVSALVGLGLGGVCIESLQGDELP